MNRRNKNAEELKFGRMGLFQPSQVEMDRAKERIRHEIRSAAVDASVEILTAALEEEPGGASDSVRPVWRTRRLNRLALVSCVAAVAVALVLFLGIPRGHDASFVVESADGSLSRISGNQNQLVKLGERIEAGEVLRTNDPTASILLADGSRVETRARTEFSVESVEDGVRIHLRKGGLIVNAAKQHAGHLYVLTRDVLVSVVGTVFFVNAEEEGSRVAVIEGEVHVQQGATEKKLRPGEQMATNPKMEPVPVKEELTWSRQAVEHVVMLEQAQSSRSGSPAPAARPKFATASVRPVSEDELTQRLNKGEPGLLGNIKCLGVDGQLWETEGTVHPGARRGRCTAQAVDLREVVQGAYATYRHRPPWERMAGFPTPASFHVMFFQIEAVADDPEHVTKGELKLMLQTLLEDRFKARVHLETREVDGYALTIAKSGIKFKETSGDVTPRRTLGPRERGDGGLCPYGSNPIISYIRGKCGMGDVAAFLKMLLAFNGASPPIADNTGLMGIYNIDFAPEEIRVSPPIGTGVRGAGSQQARQFTPPIPKALEEQLGLHLERLKVPVEFVVVDHIEQPTEN